MNKILHLLLSSVHLATTRIFKKYDNKVIWQKKEDYIYLCLIGQQEVFKRLTHYYVYIKCLKKNTHISYKKIIPNYFHKSKKNKIYIQCTKVIMRRYVKQSENKIKLKICMCKILIFEATINVSFCALLHQTCQQYHKIKLLLLILNYTCLHYLFLYL